MLSLEDVWLRGITAERRVVELALGPWGGAARYIDAYESRVGTVSDFLRAIARVAGFEPVRTVVAAAADLTRDIGAAQASAARWLLDA
jgi:alpha-D-ribose 1-methylphosphonate 5-triphosphate synthase subunit PhnL